MAPLNDYEDLSQLVSSHMRPGVVTNTMVTPGEYGPAIAAGTLDALETPAGLLLLRDRTDHTRLNFYLNDLSRPLDTPLPSPTVAEVAFRPRDTGLQETVTYLRGQGFTSVFERVRLSRPAGPAGEPALPLLTPGPENTPWVLSFLRENFNPLTGCLPTEEELAGQLAQGRVLVLEEKGQITGLLHFVFDGKTGEIRHLAVRSDRRGTGRTRPLLAGYLQAIGGAKSIVWTRRDDLAAQTAYGRFGFTPDGRRSAVLCYTEKEGI